MDPILQKFLQAEQDFFHAVDVDQRLLEDFATRWQTLWSEWEHRLHQADHKTRLLVDGVVSRVEGLAADLQAFESRSRSLGNDLFSDLEDVFASLTLEDSNLPCSESALFEVFKVPESPLQDSGAISPAQWLLCNLHNPYPLPHMRFSNPAMNSKRVKDWFAKARQRIGWTRLLRDRFAGCRSLATDAAFRAFVRDDPTNPLDDDLRTAFLAIKSHAELVYGKEDVSHPSHKRLRSVSPTPSLTFSCSSEDTEVTDDENSLSPSANGDFKRSTKRAPPDTSDTPPLKRRRTYPQTSSVSSQSNGIASQRKRKRRLSESDNDDTRPKRPRGIEGGRLHIVSDSHLATVAPAWFDPDQSFRLPSPVSTSPVELHSFDLDFFNPPSLPSGVISSIPAPTDVAFTTDNLSTLFEIPGLELLQTTPPTFEADWTEFLNFEHDLSFFPPSPSLAPSSTSTPPLVDDVILSPSSPTDSDPSSPESLPNTFPHLDGKDIPFPPVGEPIIQGEDFLLPAGDKGGITSITALLSVC